MIGYVMVGTNNLDRATAFYDALLAPLGLVRTDRVPEYAAYAPATTREAIEFYVTTPFDRRTATAGNGTMIAFQAPSMAALRWFHDIGIRTGGTDEGAPGPRAEGSDISYAYIRDPDGNKICAFCNDPGTPATA